MCLPKYCALFSKPNVLGVASLVPLPGVGVPDVAHQTLAPRGEMPVWCDPSLLYVAMLGWVLWESVSASPAVRCGPFIFCCGEQKFI